MEAKEIFAKRLVDLREKKGITQQTLADDLGITRQSLSLYEKAERTINIDIIVKIAYYFNVSTDYLLGLAQAKTTNAGLRSICDYTKLSEEAIKMICRISLSPDRLYSNTLNLIFSSPQFAILILGIRHWLNCLDLLESAIDIFKQRICEYGEELPDDIMKFAAEICLEDPSDVRSCVYGEAVDIMKEQDNVNYCEYKVQIQLKRLLDELKKEVLNNAHNNPPQE